MSTLKVTTIQDTSGGSSSTSAEIYSGRCKAWVTFTMYTTQSIDNDYNVSSITDNGVGDTTITFSSSLPTADYAAIGTSGSAYGVYASCTMVKGENTRVPTLKTTSACRIICTQTSTQGALDDGCVNWGFFA